MDWITDKIAIGNFAEAEDRNVLQEAGINSVLGLVNTLKGRGPADLGLGRIEIVPLVDGAGNDPRLFRRAVDLLAELVRDAPPVLVHCRAGRSRSPVVVAGYFMKSLRIEPEEALRMVAAKREIYIVAEMARHLDNLT